MKYLKKLIYYYSNFSGTAERLEYTIYIVFHILTQILIIDLYLKTDWNDRTIVNLFYIWLIVLITFIPIQAVTIRRLRNLKINGGLIFINYIPGIKILFKLYLMLAKAKKN
jgi:uncharacterized membrane protein YhaH (DUF805 family)